MSQVQVFNFIWTIKFLMRKFKKQPRTQRILLTVGSSEGGAQRKKGTNVIGHFQCSDTTPAVRDKFIHVVDLATNFGFFFSNDDGSFWRVLERPET